MSVRILLGDCRQRLRELPDASVDSCVCDPPYHLTSIVKRFGAENAAPAQSKQTGVYARSSKGFMGQTWDGGDVAFDPETWAEVLRVLKPGGHLVAFSGTRTYHRMAVAIEDAGFEIRDQLAWVYGSGFPKSLDVSKAIDKVKDWSLVEKLAAEFKRAREESGLSLKQIGEATQAATGDQYGAWYHRGGHMFFETGRRLPSRPEWEQLRKVLPIKPEFARVYDQAEREVVGSKTYRRSDEGSWASHVGGGMYQSGEREHAITAPATEAAQQWQGWGTALKPSWEPICLARKPIDGTVANNVLAHGTGALNIDGCRIEGVKPKLTTIDSDKRNNPIMQTKSATNTGEMTTEGRWPANLCHDGSDEVLAGFPDSEGSGPARTLNRSAGQRDGDWGMNASAADSSALRDAGDGSAARFFYCAKATTEERGEGNNHPTVKPVALMRWLCRLVTPKGGTVLDPFMGSGSTGLAADAEQFNFIGCELSADYAEIARARITAAAGMFADVSIEHIAPTTQAA